MQQLRNWIVILVKNYNLIVPFSCWKKWVVEMFWMVILLIHRTVKAPNAGSKWEACTCLNSLFDMEHLPDVNWTTLCWIESWWRWMHNRLTKKETWQLMFYVCFFAGMKHLSLSQRWHQLHRLSRVDRGVYVFCRHFWIIMHHSPKSVTTSKSQYHSSLSDVSKNTQIHTRKDAWGRTTR